MKILLDPPLKLEEALIKYDVGNVEFLITKNSYPNIIGIEFDDIEKVFNVEQVNHDVLRSYIEMDLKKNWVLIDDRNLVYIPEGEQQADIYKKYITALDAVNRKSKDFPAPIARRIARTAARFDLNLDLFESFSIRENSTVHSAYRYDIHDLGVVTEYFLRNGMMNVGGVWLDEFGRTFIHEYGHSTWHRILTDEDKEEYEDIIPEFDKKPDSEEGTPVKSKAYSITGEMGYGPFYTYEEDPFVTTYARFNTKEDFAESFLYYVVRPDKLRELSPERYSFIRKAFEKTQGFGDIEKADTDGYVSDEGSRFGIVEILPVDLQLTNTRRELAKRFKIDLDEFIKSKGLKAEDVKYIIPIGNFARKAGYPDEIEVIVYIPDLGGNVTLTKPNVRIITTNNKKEFEGLAYKHQYIETDPDKPIKKGGKGSGRLWIPKDKISHWITTRTGARIPIPKGGFKGRRRREKKVKLPLGHAKKKAQVSYYKVPKTMQTRMTVQTHEAERAGKHADLRIAMDKHAYSWAIPKGMPEPGGRVLAVLQPPHTKDYMGWQGAIKTGYGKGVVRLTADDQVDIVNWGKRLKKFRIYAGPNKGTYHMVRSKIPGSNKWILIRSRRLRTPIKEQWDLARARMKTKGFMWKSPNYVVQPKVDGARYALYTGKDGGENRILSRKPSKLERDVITRSMLTGEKKKDTGFVERTDNLDFIRDANLRTPDSIIDGEIFIGDNELTSSIMGSSPMKSRAKQKKIGKPTFFVFDVLKYRGRDIRKLPYRTRLKFAEQFVKNAKHPNMVAMPSVWKNKLKFAKELIKQGWEGAVLKDATAPYYGNFMSKFKRFQTGDMVVTGYKPGKGNIRGMVGSLELSQRMPDGSLKYVGRVGTGINRKTRRWLTENIDAIIEDKGVVEVKMLARTKSGKVRAPVFMRMRPDKHWTEATG